MLINTKILAGYSIYGLRGRNVFRNENTGLSYSHSNTEHRLYTMPSTEVRMCPFNVTLANSQFHSKHPFICNCKVPFLEQPTKIL